MPQMFVAMVLLAALSAPEFYTASRMWHRDGDINVDGLQVVAQIYAEQTQLKGPVPNAAKYLDQSFLKEALRELGR